MSYYGNGAWVIDDQKLDEEIRKEADIVNPEKQREKTSSELKKEVRDKDREIMELKTKLEKSQTVVEKTIPEKELKKLKESCPRCGRALKISWTVCPFCKASLAKRADLRSKSRKSSS